VFFNNAGLGVWRSFAVHYTNNFPPMVYTTVYADDRQASSLPTRQTNLIFPSPPPLKNANEEVAPNSSCLTS